MIANRDRGDAKGRGARVPQAGIKRLYGTRDYEMAVFGLSGSFAGI